MSVIEKAWLYVAGAVFAVAVVILLAQVMRHEKVRSLSIACSTETFEMKEQACAQLNKSLVDIVTVPFASHVW